jgi:ubiquinone/menaquinone biosynthesis C-methylase UbiE
MPSTAHWQNVYETRPADAVRWYQAHARQSLAMLKESGVSPDAPIIDVGGGASTLVDDLLAAGHRQVMVLDLSEAAIAAAKERLGADASRVNWLVGDVTQVELPSRHYGFWHDRAVFHFLTSAEKRTSYVRHAWRAVKPNGRVMVASFAEDGPSRCSGLPTMRYSAPALQAEFAAGFRLLAHTREEHRTPFGAVQPFNYCLFGRLS